MGWKEREERKGETQGWMDRAMDECREDNGMRARPCNWSRRSFFGVIFLFLPSALVSLSCILFGWYSLHFPTVLWYGYLHDVCTLGPVLL
jgi:hypothetical protein